ncbi:MAG: RtcB family protein [Candidatus Anammoxibacter sp.]
MVTDNATLKFEKIDEWRWRIPKVGGMRVDGIIYANEKMMDTIKSDQSPLQVANVAHLPGIIKHSLAMPDIHWGYGFPIGGVAAFDIDEGVISPGGVGYDINCGVRLLRSKLNRNDISDKMKSIMNSLFKNIPTGLGSRRKDMKLSIEEEKGVLNKGAEWAVDRGFGTKEDLAFIEENGCLQAADTKMVSDRALERGRSQVGTLGSGNHFVEVGFVSEIYDHTIANVLGLEKNQITVVIHTGSRGLGYQICDDYIKIMINAAREYGISLPDRQLCCAPIKSQQGKAYFGAMACAANFAFANRQMITHWVRESFEQVLGDSKDSFGLNVVYDVCHNIAKFEKHNVNGKEERVCVHRKGATRAFPPNHDDTPTAYKSVGQPLLVPGDMGRYSYVMVGTETAMNETFGSSCHGAGRRMSRTAAKKLSKGRNIEKELESKGIFVRATGRSTLTEEMPEAYKDVSEVVDIVHHAGIGKKVAQLRPLAVIKG